MASYQGFCGATYQAQSPSIAQDRCVNWYPESAPPNAKASVSYYPTPGLITHADASAYGAGRGAFAVNGRKFAVCGNTLLEFDAAGTLTVRGSILANDGLPVSFAANSAGTPGQIAISSGGKGYLFGADNILAAMVDDFLGASKFCFLDGYLIALTPGTRSIQLSGIDDGASWSALDVSANNGSADLLVSIETDHEYLYNAGNRRITVYYNSGNSDFPLVPVSGAVIEQGVKAAASLKRGDNSLLWLGQNEDGGDVLYRAQGFVPQRVSTHAVEQAWQAYARTDDAIAFVSQQNGHTFYRITFPSADATWVYDVTTGLWHERASFDSATGTLHAQTQLFHCYDAGVHYVVGSDGVIYRESATTYTDAGRTIRRVRVAPVIYKENKQVFVGRLEVVIQPGVGLDGDATAQGANPQMMLRYSGDSGRTWSNELTTYAGMIGDADARAIFDSLGSGRAWIPEISVTDPVNWVLVSAEIDVAIGAR